MHRRSLDRPGERWRRQREELYEIVTVLQMMTMIMRVGRLDYVRVCVRERERVRKSDGSSFYLCDYSRQSCTAYGEFHLILSTKIEGRGGRELSSSLSFSLCVSQ